jgi:hypothetical protein
MDPDSDPDPDVFISDLEDVNKVLFFSTFFVPLSFESTLTSFFKDKKSQRSHKQNESMFFLRFLIEYRKIRIRIHVSD